ncbi:MAG: PKD domain-containing protein [Bacteroidota bacterium]|nr:PKD domain-containing protein [Bacteroidota bacterium]
MKRKFIPFLVFLATAFIACKKDQGTSNTSSTKAQASFTVNYDGKSAPVTVSFTNTSKNANSFIWDFDDGTKSNSSYTTVTNTYYNSGLYLIVLQAIGAPGDTSEDIKPINIK